MSWVSEQVKERIKADDSLLKEAMVDLSSVVLGKKVILEALEKNEEKTSQAVEEILKYYKINVKNPGPEGNAEEKKLDSILNPYGVMYRKIKK